MSSETFNIDIKYNARHFQHLPGAVGAKLWEFLTRGESIVRLQTAASMGRPPVEGLANVLIAEFGHEIAAPAVKQVIGHMVKQIMEALGYEVHKRRAKARSGFFSTGMSFRRPTPSGPDHFNCWLDAQIRSPDGALDPDKIARVASDWGVTMAEKRVSVTMERLELAVKLRVVVPPSYYEAAEGAFDNE
jgi:hypothetical protein